MDQDCLPLSSIKFSRLESLLKQHQEFVLLSHVNPDADAISSQLVLFWLLRSWGKEVSLVSKGPFSRTDIAPFANYFKKTLPKDPTGSKVYVFLDCSYAGRTGYAIPPLVTRIVIDHHIFEQKSGNQEGQWHYFIDDLAPSTTFLLYVLFKQFREPIMHRVAFHLFLGLVTDTGNFSFTKTNTKAFLCAHFLVQEGLDPKRVYRFLKSGFSLKDERYYAYLLQKTQVLAKGKVLYLLESVQDRQKFSIKSFDKSLLYHRLMAILGVQVLFHLFCGKDYIKGSFRSHTLDIEPLARVFGGGGHKNAAGFQSYVDVGTIEKVLLKKLQKLCLPKRTDH